MNFLFLNIPRENNHEIKFFDEMYQYLIDNGHKITVMTNINSLNDLNDKINKIKIPRRNLVDISPTTLRWYQLFKFSRHHKKVRWVTHKEEQDQLNFEKYRYSKNTNYKDLIRGLRFLENLIEETIKNNKIDYIITFNQIDHLQKLGKLYANYFKLNYFTYERSEITGKFWREKKGFFSENSLLNNSEQIKYFDSKKTALNLKYKNNITNSPYGYRENQIFPKPELELKKKLANKKNIFIPMDNVLWTGWLQENKQWEKDYKGLEGPKKTFKTLREVIDMNEFNVLIKPHPSCNFINKNVIPKDFIYFENDFLEILPQIDVVICFLSKLGLVLKCFDKPVIQLTESIFTKQGIFTYSNLENLGNTLSNLGDGKNPEHEKFLNLYFENYCLNSKQNLDSLKEFLI
jgi:hypothetical protein